MTTPNRTEMRVLQEEVRRRQHDARMSTCSMHPPSPSLISSNSSAVSTPFVFWPPAPKATLALYRCQSLLKCALCSSMLSKVTARHVWHVRLAPAVGASGLLGALSAALLPSSSDVGVGSERTVRMSRSG